MSEYFKPYDAELIADPYPVYRQLREQDPILESAELGLTLFSRYEDVLALLRDSRLGRAFETDDNAEPAPVRPPMTRLPHYRRYVSDNLLEHEGKTHSRLRCIFSNTLGPSRINSLEDRIEHLATERVNIAREMGQFEFLEDIAIPLTVTVIAELLGWPESERHRLRPWSAQIVRLYEKDCDETDETLAETAARDFAAMVDELAELRKRRPRDDVISNFVAFEAKGDLRNRDELISSCMLLLNAGHEATVNASGNGLLALLRHPEQLNLLRTDAALIPGAIEEMLRYESPLHLFHRYVLEDLDYRGVALKRGQTVGLLYGSANRDPTVFDQPDRFDIKRRPNRHLAFGAENHFCLGAPLARMELAAVFRQLMRRMPNLQLIDDQATYRPGFVFRGLSSLPLQC